MPGCILIIHLITKQIQRQNPSKSIVVNILKATELFLYITQKPKQVIGVLQGTMNTVRTGSQFRHISLLE